MIVGQLHLNKSGRMELDNEELGCGNCLSVLIYDGVDNSVKWIDTRLEHDGENYYLVGLSGYSPVGLFGRIDSSNKI